MDLQMTTSIKYPFTPEKIRDLKLGQAVNLTGRIFTGRDRVHKYLFEGGDCPVNLRDGAMFHCGPIILRRDGTWVCKGIGPTTSMREEPYMARIIERCGVRLIIGKGGMGPATQAACAKVGCVYLQAVGGAAQVLGERVTKVNAVQFRKEFGNTEAMWELEAVDFPAIVAIDSRGRSLHRKVLMSSRRSLAKLFKKDRSFRE